MKLTPQQLAILIDAVDSATSACVVCTEACAVRFTAEASCSRAASLERIRVELRTAETLEILSACA